MAAHHNLQCDPSIDVAHGLKADISPTFADVRFTQKAEIRFVSAQDIGRLFIVSECKQLVRGLKPERFGCLRIDAEIEFGRLYNWEDVI